MTCLQVIRGTSSHTFTCIASGFTFLKHIPCFVSDTIITVNLCTALTSFFVSYQTAIAEVSECFDGFFVDDAAGFDGVVMEFEGWVGLLLLDTVQRAGFFRAAGQRQSLADIRASIPAEFSRFAAEAMDLLINFGESPSSTIALDFVLSPIPCQSLEEYSSHSLENATRSLALSFIPAI